MIDDGPMQRPANPSMDLFSSKQEKNQTFATPKKQLIEEMKLEALHSQQEKINRDRASVKTSLLCIKAKRKRIQVSQMNSEIKRRINLDDTPSCEAFEKQVVEKRRARYLHLFQ
mmetsp:Transcript_14013/g.16404  ORF Transcript_14013/g.16404 Transcript_14013/m.16404 type:complete len:114 (-) Transcript_14013:141-482(-)